MTAGHSRPSFQRDFGTTSVVADCFSVSEAVATDPSPSMNPSTDSGKRSCERLHAHRDSWPKQIVHSDDHTFVGGDTSCNVILLRPQSAKISIRLRATCRSRRMPDVNHGTGTDMPQATQTCPVSRWRRLVALPTGRLVGGATRRHWLMWWPARLVTSASTV